ncbi:MAG: hypothetical protein J3R72DRAFT_486493 [Linnemannia gamsii]|nr:MAG: hypothetical protein J3R72DRAFT_486493 [Linnemannia gamsii]
MTFSDSFRSTVLLLSKKSLVLFVIAIIAPLIMHAFSLFSDPLRQTPITKVLQPRKATRTSAMSKGFRNYQTVFGGRLVRLTTLFTSDSNVAQSYATASDRHMALFICKDIVPRYLAVVRLKMRSVVNPID